MSLTSDLKQVFLKNLTDDGEKTTVPDKFMDDKAQELASGIAQAINAWVKEQTFEITQFKAPITVQQLVTTAPLFSIVGGAQTISWPGGVTGPLQPVITDPLNLSDKGSVQGGALTSKGTTTINTNPDDSRNEITAVKLTNEVEV